MDQVLMTQDLCIGLLLDYRAEIEATKWLTKLES